MKGRPRPCRLVPADQWDRRMHGPYTIKMQNTKTGAERWSDETEHISAAVRGFVGTKPFPYQDRRVGIIDADGWVVLAYCTDEDHMRAYGVPIWWGSAFGFAVIESDGLLDPIDAAIMESMARDAAPAKEIEV